MSAPRAAAPDPGERSDRNAPDPEAGDAEAGDAETARSRSAPHGRALLDVNVLLALAWPNHVHHAVARRWLTVTGTRRWATTALTQLGFVRLSSNPTVTDEAVPPALAVELLDRLCDVSDHEHWVDDLPLHDDLVPWTRVTTHRQVTDARLLAVALRHGGRLATFDRRLRRLTDPGTREAVEVITAEDVPVR